MSLDFESFDDFENEKHRRGGSRKSRPADRKTKETVQDETPEKKVERRIEKLKLEWHDLDKDQQNQNFITYYKWVKTSLREKQPLYEESDLEIQVNDKITILKHMPTGYFALSVGLESEHLRKRDAEINLYNRIDRHFQNWSKTSDKFKQEHLGEV